MRCISSAMRGIFYRVFGGGAAEKPGVATEGENGILLAELMRRTGVPQLPVMYELDHNGEATGTTVRFCSERCAAATRGSIDDSGNRWLHYGWGTEPLACIPDGELCFCCGTELKGEVHEKAQ